MGSHSGFQGRTLKGVNSCNLERRYNRGMKPLIELVQSIDDLAIPSNIVYGTQIFERGAVEWIEYSPERVEAWAGGLDGTVKEGGGTRRRVQLASTPDGLTWHCTGNPKHHDIFCKHCVAVALAIKN
jgi:uncharacterized Zn finger protein